jgi:hypothetical protein
MATIKLRYRPESYVNEIVNEEFGIECFYQTTPKCIAILYVGKSAKHLFHFSFNKDESRMMEFINEKINNIVANKTADKERKEKKRQLTAEMKAEDHFKIGDIIVNSWGHEQTNVEFYQVVEVLNKKIRVREIYQETERGSEVSHGMACRVLPAKDIFMDKEAPFLLSLKIEANGECYICNPTSYYYFHKWSGKSEYKSWYA